MNLTIIPAEPGLCAVFAIDANELWCHPIIAWEFRTDPARLVPMVSHGSRPTTISFTDEQHLIGVYHRSELPPELQPEPPTMEYLRRLSTYHQNRYAQGNRAND